MRYLFYASCSFFKLGMAVLSDEAEQFVREGNEVYFLFCDEAINTCSGNPCSNKGLCKTCKLWTKLDLSKLNKKIIIKSLCDYKEDSHSRKWEYKDVDELKYITYRGASIGLSVLSSYIDFTRNLNPLIDEDSKIYFDNSLNQAASLVDSIALAVQDIKPDCFCLYNGRLVETRGVLDYMISQKIDTRVMEVVPDIESGQRYKVLFKNCLPQDIKANHRRYEEIWEESKLPEQKKIEIAESFYQNRRNHKAAGDQIFAASQQAGLLPAGFDSNKRNIVIFNSSEDEMAAIGGEYFELPLFDKQIEGIRFILQSNKDNNDIHFYLRIHPNLKKVNYKYHTDLYDLPKEFNNVTVIGASESVDTYILMDNADKIIVFNSTMGIESAYWHKPVILLGAPLYYYANICYVPKTADELQSMIIANLEPKFNDFIYKYGFKIMAAKESTIDPDRYKYYDWTPFSINVFGNKAEGVAYQTLFGSKKLALFVFSVMRVLSESFCKNKFTLPLKEA